MPVKRRLPKGRDLRITPAALAIFAKMRRLKCTCASVEDDSCFGCIRFCELDGDLARELGLRPWQHPAIEDPDAAYAANATPDAEAQERWRMLAQAAREARKAAEAAANQS